MTASENRRNKVPPETERLLWASSAGLCEYWWEDDNCLEPLLQRTPSGQLVAIGRRAHVVPIGRSGPRAGAAPLGGNLDAFENLVMLCPKHHLYIDADVATFSVKALSDMKMRWEQHVNPLIRLSAPARAVAEDYKRVTNLAASEFRLEIQTWTSLGFGLKQGRSRWYANHRIAARAAAIDLFTCWVRPSVVPTLSSHADEGFEAAVIALAEAMLELDCVFGERADPHDKPAAWESYDWEALHPFDASASAAGDAAYSEWESRLVAAWQAAEDTRTQLIREVVRRDLNLLNQWP